LRKRARERIRNNFSIEERAVKLVRLIEGIP